MASFSWSDTARAAFGYCLPCLPSERRGADNDDDDNDGRQGSRRDELESLLQSAEHSDAEMDVDALSLHSRLGQHHDGRRTSRRKKRARKKGSITLCGFDLFGRPLRRTAGADEGDDDENITSDGEHDRVGERISRISSSTLDSDAAPLADDAIAALSAQTEARQEAQEAREARRARKKRLREEARLTAGLAAPGDAFEGFPGSGPPPAPADTDDFGVFQQARGDGDEMYGDADANADFDAGSYVRGAAPRSDSDSGTRSRSASASNTSDPTRAPRTYPRPPSSPSPLSSGPLSSFAAPLARTKSRRPTKKSGKRSTTTASSSASQPRSPTDAVYIPRIGVASPTFEGFPEDGAFEGVPQGGDGHDDDIAHAHSLKLTGESVHGDLEGHLGGSQGIPSQGLARFPSTGLGRSDAFPSPSLGERKHPQTMSGKGAFLARTGDDA